MEDLTLDLDTVTLNLTKAIEAKKVKTADLNAQFEQVQGGTEAADKAAADKAAAKKKGAARDAAAADAARRNPGSIAYTYGSENLGINSLEGLTPSRITSRGKSRGGSF